MFGSIVATLALVAAMAQPAPTMNIVQLAESVPDLKYLVDLVSAAGLVPTLEGPGPFTVFAPVDQGFDNLPKNVVDFLINPYNVKSLQTVLTYHVHAGEVKSNQITNGEIISTVDGTQTLNATVGGGKVKINNANVISADNLATNGVVHLIDNVLVPGNFALPPSSIVAIASATPALSTLVTAVTTAGIASVLANDGPFTVFAPTNDAFNALPAGELQYLLAHPDELKAVLFYHVLDHRVYSTEIQNLERFPTLLQGQEVIAVVSSEGVSINAVANVTQANIQATNGVVHVINAVLIPNQVRARAAAWTAVREGAPLPNIVELAQSVPFLSTLVKAVVAGNLVKTLSGPTPILTVLAPNDDAFAQLPSAFLASLLQNVPLLDQVLTYHCIAGNISSSQITNNETATTVEGSSVTFYVDNGRGRQDIYVNGNDGFFDGARVIVANQYASNGVVHIIDQVLLPSHVSAEERIITSRRA